MNHMIGAQPIHSCEIRTCELQTLVGLIHSMTGISIALNKKELVTARLRKRLYALGMDNFTKYIQHLETTDGREELTRFIDEMTTNTTHFFREMHHFNVLTEVLGENCTRIWSAGCSSGNEAYSIAMVLAERFGGDTGRFEIIGTDISQRMLKKASLGIYDQEEIEPHVPLTYKTRYLLKGKGQQLGKYRVVPELRQQVHFQYMNLVDDGLTPDSLFDAIFCRNVIIYFDSQTRIRLISKFVDCLAPGGYLFLGHSETLTGISDKFELVQPTIYRKRSN